MSSPADGADGPAHRHDDGHDDGHDDAYDGHDEALPPPGDPYWADLTSQTLAFVRRLRAAERRRRLGSAAYSVYVVLVVALMYGLPYVWFAVTRPHQAGPSRTAATWALGAVGVAMLVVVGFLRDGAWRGPAVLDRPTAAWLLPAPIDKAALLRPRWRTALALGTGTGAVLGGLGGVVVRVVAGGPADLVAAGGAVAGLLLGAGGTACGLLAEAARRPMRGGTLLWLVPTAVLAGAAAAAGVLGVAAAPGQDHLGGSTPDGAVARAGAGLLVWSGPWGWAVQPFLAALPGTADGGVERLWPVGLALAVLTTAGLVVAAGRRVATIDTIGLRARADSVALVGASIVTLQPRRARLTVLAAQGRAPSTRRRLPVPRHRLLLGLWRDATALLRAPSRLVWSLVWLVVATGLLTAGVRAQAGLAGAAVDLRAVRGERLLLGVPGLVALYLAAAQLVEPARLDADDADRMRIRPVTATRQALTHAVVPLLLLAVALTAALGVVWAVPIGLVLRDSLLEALAALPVMVGAALVSAYRGEAPIRLLATGSPTPLGDPGPTALLAWYARAPLVAVALLLPLLLHWSIAVSVTSVAAVVMLTWAGSRAEALLRS